MVQQARLQLHTQLLPILLLQLQLHKVLAMAQLPSVQSWWGGQAGVLRPLLTAHRGRACSLEAPVQCLWTRERSRLLLLLLTAACPLSSSNSTRRAACRLPPPLLMQLQQHRLVLA